MATKNEIFKYSIKNDCTDKKINVSHFLCIVRNSINEKCSIEVLYLDKENEVIAKNIFNISFSNQGKDKHEINNTFESIKFHIYDVMDTNEFVKEIKLNIIKLKPSEIKNEELETQDEENNITQITVEETVIEKPNTEETTTEEVNTVIEDKEGENTEEQTSTVELARIVATQEVGLNNNNQNQRKNKRNRK